MHSDPVFKSPAIIKRLFVFAVSFFILSCNSTLKHETANETCNVSRERISINKEWKFYKYDSISQADHLIYDIRPEVRSFRDNRPADARPSQPESVKTVQKVLKPWILPSGNDFIKDTAKRFIRPEGNPGSDFPFVRNDFDDGSWQVVNLPHDWAAEGPFIMGHDAETGGSMGRLPSPGVAWYRKKLEIPASDTGRSIYLDVEGAMSYATVWLNGNLVGGWPYGYASWRLDLTPYIIPGGDNQLAIRLDNPPASSRWYPGGGIYRNVWLVKTDRIHIDHWGTFITAHDISEASAIIDMEVTVENDADHDTPVRAVTRIYRLDNKNARHGKAVVTSELVTVLAESGKNTKILSSVTLKNPSLWGPPPAQVPNLYVAVTTLWQNDRQIDQYDTRFGIRTLSFNPGSGIYINGELIKIRGVNQHHDLGALGAAFNKRAAERQLETLRDMGCNAIRFSHNPPAPESLELTDKMGFLVMDEAFDVWVRKKTPLDFHLIFPDWYEQDLRALVRRDRNSPSVIMWSIGNEVGEQYAGEEGAALAEQLRGIIREEDETRPTTSAMNWARPDMPFPAATDVISLNYQGEGIRQDPMFEGTDRIRTSPQYPAFHAKFPGKVILSSETASTFSSRGIYLFPATDEISSPVRDGRGGDSKIRQVSAYDLYAVDFGASPDKVFLYLERNPFVAGQFVWTGWDYLGEPTPYYSSRSSYSGIIDLAGFRKDGFYLYQSQWRPNLSMVHILPHWNWPERTGRITPVHIFTSGDEAELFLNGRSLGKKKKGQYEYRLRWDEVKYEPGELKAIAYKNGKKWAEETVVTTGKPSELKVVADRKTIKPDGKDLSFITVKVTDDKGHIVPHSDNLIEFTIEGTGIIAATDNGDPTDMLPFPSHRRKAFNGLALVIVQSEAGEPGTITLTAKSAGLTGASTVIKCR